MVLEDAHLWIGRFDSSGRWQAYLEEHYDDGPDERPLSQFAADQNEVWYDHDWIECNFSGESLSDSAEADATALFSELSYASSYIDAAVADAMRAPLVGANACISINSDEISNPRSVTGDGYELRFVGTYQRSHPPPQFDPAATELSLTDQRLSETPSEVFEMTNLVELNLGNNALTSIPDEIGRLRNLEEIHLYRNQLADLPDSLFALPKLRKVNAFDNRFRSLPTKIGAAANLETLVVSNSRIAHLPEEIGDLGRLELLDLSGNELTELPSAIGRLRQLTCLRIGGNEIRRLPDEITALTISEQLSLPQFFDAEAQSPAVRAWLADPGLAHLDRRRRGGVR